MNDTPLNRANPTERTASNQRHHVTTASKE
jgi:hypothetical protein